MRISVKLFGPQAKAVGDRSVTVDVADGQATCAVIRRALAGKYPQIAATLGGCRFAVNQEFVEEDAPVTADDEIALIGQVSGG